MNPLLEIQDLKKTFALSGKFRVGSRHVRAVDNVDLSIKEGEHLGLVGESGSGKSTLARLILKLYSVDSGNILLHGCDITRLSQSKFRKHRHKVQMVFQDPSSSLDPRFTVRRILDEATTLLYKKLPRKEKAALMVTMLQKTGLDEGALSRYPHEFSGGERQRIAIARALMMRPRLLILDEAVSALDVLIQAQIIELLDSLEKEFGFTYLFITHNLRAARKLCSRIAVMYQGKIVEAAAAEELFSNPLHPYTRRLLTAALDFKSPSQTEEIDLDKNSRLIEHGEGHFVLD
jgi:ABC-type oligopeptide transport system ATPase subunit